MNKVAILVLAFVAITMVNSLHTTTVFPKDVYGGLSGSARAYTTVKPLESNEQVVGLPTSPLEPVYIPQKPVKTPRNHKILPRMFGPNIDGLTAKLNDIANNVREINKKIKKQ